MREEDWCGWSDATRKAKLRKARYVTFGYSLVIDLRKPIELPAAIRKEVILYWYTLMLAESWPGSAELPEVREPWSRQRGRASRSTSIEFWPSARVLKRLNDDGAIPQLLAFLSVIMEQERVEGARQRAGKLDGRVSVWPAMTVRWPAGVIRVDGVDFACVPDAGALT